MIMDHHPVASVLELVATFDGQLAADTGQIPDSFWFKDERGRIHRNGGRLHELGSGLQPADLVVHYEITNPNLHRGAGKAKKPPAAPHRSCAHLDLRLTDIKTVRAEVGSRGCLLPENCTDLVGENLAGNLSHVWPHPEEGKDTLPESKFELKGESTEV